MAFKDNIRLEQIYFQNIKSTIDVLKSWKGNTEDGKTADIIDAVITCDNAVLLLYKNIGECWNELTAQIQKEMKDLADLKQQVENYHDELNEKIDDVNNYIMAIIREIEGRLDIIENDLATLQRNRIFELVYDEDNEEYHITYNGAVVDFDTAYELLVSEEGVLGNGWVHFVSSLNGEYYFPLVYANKDEEDEDNNILQFSNYVLKSIGYRSWNRWLNRSQVLVDAYGVTYSDGSTTTDKLINYGKTEYIEKCPCDSYLSDFGTTADDEITLDLTNAPYIFGSKSSIFSVPVSNYTAFRYIQLTAPKLLYQYSYQFDSDVKVPYDCVVTVRAYKATSYTDANLLGSWQVSFKGCVGVNNGTTAQRIPTIEGADEFLIDMEKNINIFSEEHGNFANLYLKFDYSISFNDVYQALDTSLIRSAVIDRKLRGFN